MAATPAAMAAAMLAFTGGATEALNWAIKGTTGPIVTIATEHAAVLDTVRAGGRPATILPVGSDGLVDVDAARAAGFADLVAPPTFPIVVQQRTWDQLLDDPEAGIVLERIVHGDQRFTYTRPIVAGDELTATLRVTGIKTLGGNAMVTSETAMVDAAGDHVVTSVSTLVVRGDDS